MLHEMNLIDGEWTDGESKSNLEVVNPATEEVFATVPITDIKDINRAVDAAYRAFSSWSQLTPFARGEFLRKASRIVEERRFEIAELMTQEQGKPLKEAIGEAEKAAQILRYYAEEGERIYGRIIASDQPFTESRVIYQPVGVAAAISPWNYPVELLAWKIGGALASGCTILCKLPTETPLSPSAFIRCIADAGIPKGVVNSLTGSGSDIGPCLIKNPVIKKIAFTGSTAVGKQVLSACTDTLKRHSLELGGSLPMVICKDCDLDEAVAGAVRRSFRNMGQICIAVNRIYADKQIYDEFLRRFAEKASELKIGNGMTDNCDLGPMCSRAGYNTVQMQIRDGLEKGARLVCGGKRPEGAKYERGYYFEPTILADVNHKMLVMKEETFGPLVGVMPFETIEEAIELSNDTEYGLASIVYTQSLALAEKLSREINAGSIAVNNPDPGVLNAPYGGWKESGLGHEHGPEGLYEYLNIKHIRLCYK